MTDRTRRLAGTGARFWLSLVVIASAILLAYRNSFPGAFFFDDDAAIAQNTSIRDLHDLRHVLWPPVEAGIGGRPFGNLSFALNYAVNGYNAWGYHAVNLAIHVAAALILFLLARHTLRLPRLRDRWGGAATELAAIIALAWGLHPLQTNIVDYMSQRTEGLMGLLYLITLYAYARSVAWTAAPAPRPTKPPLNAGAKMVDATAAAPRAELPPRGPRSDDAIEATPTETWRPGWAVTAVVACVLGMATKEDMVTAPLIVLLYDRTFLSGSFAVALRRHGGRLRALGATWAVLAALMMNSAPDKRGIGFHVNTAPFVYALTECHAVLRYLFVSLWPHPLIFDYGTDFYLHDIGAALPYAIPLAALIGLTVYALRRWPGAGFAAAWFFVLLAPSSSVVPVAQQPCAENRVYLPLVGIVALVVIAGYRAIGRRAVPILGLGAVALGLLTHLRNPAFASELAIWQDSAAKRPTNARAQNNLGNALLKHDRTAEAKAHFEKAVQLSPTYADARNNRGVVLLREGKPQEALGEFQRAAELKKDYADAYYNIGEAMLQLHRDAEAVAPLRKSLELEANNAKAHNNLGIALLDLGRVAESIAEEQKAIALNPNLPEAHYNMANSLSRAGQKEAALAEYDATLKINPKFAKAHNNAGVILLNLGRRDEARKRFEAALAIDPKYPEAKSNLELVRPRNAPTTAAPSPL